MDIEQTITKLRGAGWTLRAIGDAMGTHWITVHRWQYGKSTPSPLGPTLVALRSLASKRVDYESPLEADAVKARPMASTQE